MQAILQLDRAQLAISAKHPAHPFESDGSALLRHVVFFALFAHVALLQTLS